MENKLKLQILLHPGKLFQILGKSLLPKSTPGEVNTRALRSIMWFLLVGSVFIYLGTYVLYGALVLYIARVDQPRLPIAPRQEPLPPKPTLQVNPQQDLQNYLQRQQYQLEHYGWVDRRQEIVHIPIDRAMDLALKEVNQQ